MNVAGVIITIFFRESSRIAMLIKIDQTLCGRVGLL